MRLAVRVSLQQNRCNSILQARGHTRIAHYCIGLIEFARYAVHQTRQHSAWAGGQIKRRMESKASAWHHAKSCGKILLEHACPDHERNSARVLRVVERILLMGSRDSCMTCRDGKRMAPRLEQSFTRGRPYNVQSCRLMRLHQHLPAI